MKSSTPARLGPSPACSAAICGDSSAPWLSNDIAQFNSCKIVPPHTLSDLRENLILMERWWRRERPFQRGCARSPWIVGGPPFLGEGLRQPPQEDQHTDPGNVGTDRRDEVPSCEGIGIVHVATRHARQAQEVLRKEDQVDADERHPEVQLSDRFVVHVARHLTELVVPTG